MPFKIFFCYAHEDEPLLKKLKSHLRPLQRAGLIDVWHDRDISAGTDWEQQIKDHLNTAQIILLLVSPDFMDSDYCYGIEMQRALERDKRREARVIPIIIRPVDFEGTPFSKLQALPTDAKAVMSSSWQYQDEAFVNVTKGIRKVVEELMDSPKTNAEINISPEIVSPKASLLTHMPENPLKQAQKAKQQWLEEGSQFLHLKQYSEALAACEQAIRLDPNLAVAYSSKGIALSGLKRYDEATAAYLQAVRLDPKNSWEYFKEIRISG